MILAYLSLKFRFRIFTSNLVGSFIFFISEKTILFFSNLLLFLKLVIVSWKGTSQRVFLLGLEIVSCLCVDKYIESVLHDCYDMIVFSYRTSLNDCFEFFFGSSSHPRKNYLHNLKLNEKIRIDIISFV